MLPFMQNISKNTSTFTICYPNAGLPNTFGEYDQLPHEMAVQVKKFAELKLMNIVGGCCGTTPAHIKALYETLKDFDPRKPPVMDPDTLIVSGLEILRINKMTGFVNIGERCNVSGSKIFSKKILNGLYEDVFFWIKKFIFL
jgi:5-methyltetrahydrofolate--homocysteine methyltransferase